MNQPDKTKCKTCGGYGDYTEGQPPKFVDCKDCPSEPKECEHKGKMVMIPSCNDCGAIVYKKPTY